MVGEDALSQARSCSLAFQNNLDRRKIELAGMGVDSGEDLKGDLGDCLTVSFLWVWREIFLNLP